MRWLILSALFATTAFAGPRGRVNVNVRFGTPWLGGAGARAAPYVVYQPVYVPLAWWTWYPIQPQVVQQQPAPPPEPVIIEREIIREVPAPAPQVIVVEQAPAPAPAPAPPPPAPAPEIAKPSPPPAPRVPGPDVFTWTDEDGVTHFSTRVPPEARARARKVGSNKSRAE